MWCVVLALGGRGSKGQRGSGTRRGSREASYDLGGGLSGGAAQRARRTAHSLQGSVAQWAQPRGAHASSCGKVARVGKVWGKVWGKVCVKVSKYAS
eukprot:364635-Chlamydomonas_euryale.AAC.15